MSSLGSPNPFFIAGKKAYEIDRSLRFNNDDNTRLVRTIGSTSNRRTFTYSFWIKRSMKDAEQYVLYNGHSSSTPYFDARFVANSHTFEFIDYISSGFAMRLITNRVFRDNGAWYHFVIAMDTTQSTASDRAKLYINGVQETSFSTESYPSQNHDTGANVSGHIQVMGTNKEGTNNDLDGYLAEVNFIDGFQYDPSYFGETNSITGQWNPKKYTGSYGTNGYYLNFSDNSGTTATTLGKDSSGNGNNFTPNNFVTGDAVKDTPTNNFATWNPLSTKNLPTLSEGNLKNNGDNNTACNATFGVTSGKWYWEMHILTDVSTTNYIAATGVTSYQMENEGDTSPALASAGRSYYRGMTSGGVYAYKNYTSTSHTEVSSGGTFYGGAVISFRLDMDAGTLKYYTNNTLVHTDSTIPTDGTVIFPMQNATNSGASRHNASFINFGQDGTFAGNKTAQGNTDSSGIGNFFYAVPSGHKAMCSANLPDPTIKLPNKHFNTFLYTATGNAMSFSGLNFQPDWIWQKRRDSTSGSHFHYLFDAVRGGTQGLQSNTTGAEFTASAPNITFTSNGYDMAASSGSQGNASGGTYVSWNWNAGETDGKTYTVKVVSDSGNKYRFDDFGTSAVTLDLAEGGTYIFDQSDSSNAGHPLRFSTTSNGTHGGGSEYTTGVTTAGTPGQSGAYTQIVVAASAPTLYYYCSVHSGMGGQANTNSTLGSSNFDGSIQSTAKVNATAGFSIATWTSDGQSSPTSFGHGLGVKPDFLIIKSRGGSGNWQCWSQHFTNATNDFISLNLSDGKQTAGAAMWGTIDSSVVNFRHSANSSNGQNMIGYFFNGVAGYSKFGSYTGNGNNDGPFVFTGFTPKWILLKCAGSTGNWVLIDTERPSGGNFINYNTLSPNLASAENSSGGVTNDILSNGFKLRGGTDRNINGQLHIYLAFAESPFKNARAR